MQTLYTHYFPNDTVYILDLDQHYLNIGWTFHSYVTAIVLQLSKYLSSYTSLITLALQQEIIRGEAYDIHPICSCHGNCVMR